jgi:LacI family transcriptional regulator
MRKDALKNGQRVTIQDIAKRAGVSSASVSFALSGRGKLRRVTRERIHQIANELGYVPNFMAQALRGGRTNTLGVVINHLQNPFFIGVFNGVEEVADANGFSYLISHTHDDPEKERNQVRLMAERGVDGLIVFPCSSEAAHLEKIRDEFGIPVILIGNFFEGRNFLSVTADNWNGAKMAIEHLIALGRSPILHIAGPSDQTMCLFRRMAFEKTISTAFPAVDTSELVFHVKALTPAEGYRIMAEIVSKIGLPLSLFVVNDDTALGVIGYCREHKIAIPNDAAMVGFSDIDLLTSLRIPLTTVRIPAREMGRKAATLVIAAIQSQEMPSSERIALPVELIQRDSTNLSRSLFHTEKYRSSSG